MPGYWKTGSRGLGVYRIIIKHDSNIKIPALKLTNVMDTYKLFINGTEYYSAGIISPDPAIYTDESRPAVIPLTGGSFSGDIDVCIMVGNLTEKEAD